MDGHIASQDALDGVAFPPLGYDALYLQAYRTYSNAGPGYVAQFYRDMQSEFGAAGQVSLGDTQQGPPYDVLETLVDDVRMLAGMGAQRIPVFELGGTVQRFGTEGLRAIVEAARQPMSGAELATASAEQPYDREHRDFFQQLDDVAVALTNVVTAPPGEPEGPNRLSGWLRRSLRRSAAGAHRGPRMARRSPTIGLAARASASGPWLERWLSDFDPQER